LNQITTVNPATGEEISKFTPMDRDQVFQLVGKARRAFPEWKKDYGKRRSYIYNLVEYLKKNKTELAKIATLEMGKPLKESIGDYAYGRIAERFANSNVRIMGMTATLPSEKEKAVEILRTLKILRSKVYTKST